MALLSEAPVKKERLKTVGESKSVCVACIHVCILHEITWHWEVYVAKEDYDIFCIVPGETEFMSTLLQALGKERAKYNTFQPDIPQTSGMCRYARVATHNLSAFCRQKKRRRPLAARCCLHCTSLQSGSASNQVSIA